MKKAKKVTVKLNELQKSVISSALSEILNNMYDGQIPSDAYDKSQGNVKEIEKAISDIYKQLEEK